MEPYTYSLESEKIAERPVYPYDLAKLLAINKDKKQIKETVFKDIINYINSDYVLVFNNTKVIPARVFANNAKTGGKIELLFLDASVENEARVLARPLKKINLDTIYQVNDEYSIRFLKRIGEKEALIAAYKNLKKCPVIEVLDNCGTMPIPPYMRKGKSDKSDFKDYQSLFAKEGNSVAAPTASLHFTESLIAKLKSLNVIFEETTLHVGSASFLPVYDDGKLVPPKSEFCEYDSKFLEILLDYKKQGKKIVAVGTTVVRALESFYNFYSQKIPNGKYATELFIQPGFKFNVVDSLITNFHQPGTTHMLLVEAFLGRELLEKSYDYALSNEFRFLSYGDAMLIK